MHLDLDLVTNFDGICDGPLFSSEMDGQTGIWALTVLVLRNKNRCKNIKQSLKNKKYYA